MNLVDSCGWLEYFSDAKNAAFYAPAIEGTDRLIVPSICLLEVFKRVLQQRSEAEALQAVAMMSQGRVIDLNVLLSVEAARLGLRLKLPLADSVIYATAQAYKALIWTQDEHFKTLPNVKYIKA